LLAFYLLPKKVNSLQSGRKTRLSTRNYKKYQGEDLRLKNAFNQVQAESINKSLNEEISQIVKIICIEDKQEKQEKLKRIGQINELKI